MKRGAKLRGWPMARDLTPEAAQGFEAQGRFGDAALCPFLATSPSAMAWDCGRWLYREGMPEPGGITGFRLYSSRGDDFRLDTSKHASFGDAIWLRWYGPDKVQKRPEKNDDLAR